MSKINKTNHNGITVGDMVRGNNGKGSTMGVVGFVEIAGEILADCRIEGIKQPFYMPCSVLVVAN